MGQWYLYRIYILVIVICTASIAKKQDKDATKSSQLLKKELEQVIKTGASCPQNIVTLSTLDRLRVTQKYEKAVVCHLNYLDKNPNDPWAWSSLGSTFLLQGAAKATSKAATCFKSAAKLGGSVSGFVRQWHYLGPFIIGKMEVDGDPVATRGGIRTAAMGRYNKRAVYQSELVGDGQLSWVVYKQTARTDSVSVVPQVDWNDLVNSLSSTGILEWQGWVVGEFAVNEDGLNVVIRCLGVHTVYVDDIPIPGDVYHRESFWFSTLLDRGVHTLYIRLRAKVRAQFQCTIDSPRSDIKVLEPHFLPDLYDGYLFGEHVALPVSNNNPRTWLRNIKVTIDSQSPSLGLVVVETPQETVIAPGQTRPVRVRLALPGGGRGLPGGCHSTNVQLLLRVSSSTGHEMLPVSLRCRARGASFLFTFVDHDGSVQQAAGIEPLEGCTAGGCPVLLTLHGTTIQPQNQADSYKHMVADQYVFGFPHAWVLAPSRHGAHNWEGPGALTAMHALESLVAMTSARDWMTSKASGQHIIFAGHSMGGHGAWHLATHFPDRALAVVSLAGWIRKEDYSDSNYFFKHDVATTGVDPAVKAVLEACITENEADRLAPNLQGVAVLTRVGQADRTVHPVFVRRMYRVLQDLGVNVTYVELPGKEHWWWDTWQTNDGGAVNDPQIRDFTNYFSALSAGVCDTSGAQCDSVTDNQSASKYQQPAVLASQWTYVTTNPAFGGTVHGLRVLQQTTPFRTSSIRGNVTESDVTLLTVNVLRFVISKSLNRPVYWWRKNIKVDGQHILNANVWKGESACLCKEKGSWRLCSDCGGLESPTRRGPSNLGPARRVAERPFVIVTGTTGLPEVTRRLRQSAVYIANLFFLTSDADAPVTTDVELTQEVADQNNLIILGSPSENSWTSRYLESIPLILEEGVLQLGSCRFRDGPLGALFLAPHGVHLALVLMGNSPEAMQDVVSMAAPTIPPMTRSPFSNLVPDYVITGPEFRSQGPGGYLCTGFWGNHWDFRPELASCSYCFTP